MTDFIDIFYEKNVLQEVSIVSDEDLLLETWYEESEYHPYNISTGSKTLSALGSSLHRARIRQGNYLEPLLESLSVERLNLSVKFVFDCFIQGRVPASKTGNYWFISKDHYKKFIRPYLCMQAEGVGPDEWNRMKKRHKSIYKKLGLDFEPDALLLDAENKTLHAFEIKLGLMFDKGKSESIGLYIEKNANSLGVLLPYRVQSKACSMDAVTVEQTFNAFRGKVEKKYCVTGDQICSMLGVQKSKIFLPYEKARQANLKFCLKTVIDRVEGFDEVFLQQIGQPENRQRLQNLLEKMRVFEQSEGTTGLVVSGQFANVTNDLSEKLPA